VSYVAAEYRIRYASHLEKVRRLASLRKAAEETVLPGCTLADYSDEEFDKYNKAHSAASDCSMEVQMWSQKEEQLALQIAAVTMAADVQKIKLRRFLYQPWPSMDLLRLHELELKALAIPFQGDYNQRAAVLKTMGPLCHSESCRGDKNWGKRCKAYKKQLRSLEKIQERFERCTHQLGKLQKAEVQGKGPKTRAAASHMIEWYMAKRLAEACSQGWPTLAYEEAALLRCQIMKQPQLGVRPSTATGGAAGATTAAGTPTARTADVGTAAGAAATIASAATQGAAGTDKTVATGITEMAAAAAGGSTDISRAVEASHPGAAIAMQVAAVVPKSAPSATAGLGCFTFLTRHNNS
jgi:hypothetical protein